MSRFMRAQQWLRIFVARALVIGSDGPPWHRGVVALAGICAAVAIGQLAAHPAGHYVTPACAFLMTLADMEGRISRRLKILGVATIAMAIAGEFALLLAPHTGWYECLLVLLALIAGSAAWAGSPWLQSTRFALLTALLIGNAPGLGLLEFPGLLVMAALAIALARYLENYFVADTREGEYCSWRRARYVLKLVRPLALRFALAYTLAGACGYLLGKSVDSVHPTWVTVSTFVTMWPGLARSYERIVQRIFGTLIGAVVSLALVHLISDIHVLTVIGLALLFFVPHFLRRNYWLHSALVLVFILIAVQINALSSMGTQELISERIRDVLIGCALAVIGTLFAFGVRGADDAGGTAGR